MILHIGGVYGDKQGATKRFLENFEELSQDVKNRLVIENDDKSYHIRNVLNIGEELGLPVVFDNLHHEVNPPDNGMAEALWIEQCHRTWEKKDGKQKIHYSQQHQGKQRGSHSDSIIIDDFMRFYNGLVNTDIDIMMEVKDKNLSAIKCANCVTAKPLMKNLEAEWSKYKYSVLEKSPSAYREIRELLKNKAEYPVLDFYHILEDALQKPIETGKAINAADHVWGYFKDVATDREKSQYRGLVNQYRHGEATLLRVKKTLWRLAVKYEREFLLYSYYFSL